MQERWEVKDVALSDPAIYRPESSARRFSRRTSNFACSGIFLTRRKSLGSARVLGAQTGGNIVASYVHATMNAIQSGGTTDNQVGQFSYWRFPMRAQSMVKVGILSLAAAFLAAAGCDQKNPQAAETPPPVVLVSRPLERNVTDYQVFTARTQAVQSVDIKTRVSGFLTKVLLKDGAEVKEGDILFQIDDRPYKATLDQAKATLRHAEASLDLAKAVLVKAQADYDIGLAVQKQQAGAISDQEIVRRLGARDEAKANISEATASIGQAQAALEMAQLNYDWCKVTAPISGRSTRHLVNAGDMVTQGVTVLDNIVSLKPVWAYFNVDQNTAQQIQILTREGKIQAARKGELPVEMTVEVCIWDTRCFTQPT